MSDKKEYVNRAKDVLDRHREEIKETYLADGTAVGYKIINGRLTDKIALVFYVRKKKSKTELISEGITPIPVEIDGFPTDVVEIPEGFKPRSHT